LLLDYFTAPVDAKGFQAELLFLHSPCHNSLLLVPEISFRHSNDILCVEISSSHVDFFDRLVPPGVPKDVLVQKMDLQTQKAIPDLNLEACQPI
jgi:hypothetical protein